MQRPLVVKEKDIEGAEKSGVAAAKTIQKGDGEVRQDNEGSSLLHWEVFNLFFI